MNGRCLIDYYCPVCYPLSRGGMIAGGCVAYGEEFKGYCPICDVTFTWLIKEEGSEVIKKEKGNSANSLNRFDSVVVSEEVARILV